MVANKIPDNPQAFPFQPYSLTGQHEYPEYGMTLFDWLAGMAISGFTGPVSPESDARKAYAVANAMLKEREKYLS